jgi:hypothetical protein
MGEEKGKQMTFDPALPMKNTAKFLNIAPKGVMQSAAIHQSDIAIGLDFPIRKLKGDAQQQLEFFSKRPLNVKWAYESFAWKNALIPGAQYFQPIQCYNLEHLDIFLNDIAGVSFDGVSMPVRNLKPAELALFLVSFYQQGITRVHLLGTSSFPVIAMSAYMARKLFKYVSLDSTTWRLAADKEGFINPWDLSRTDLRPKAHVPKNAFNPCFCPYCSGRDFASIHRLEPRKDKVNLLRQHNWWAIKHVVDDLWINSVDIIQLERVLKARCRNHRKVNTLIDILSLVELLKDTDIEVLRALLTPIPKGRTQSRRSRSQTSPNLQSRNTTRPFRQLTDTSHRPIPDSNSPVKTGTNNKSLTGGLEHVPRRKSVINHQHPQKLQGSAANHGGPAEPA